MLGSTCGDTRPSHVNVNQSQIDMWSAAAPLMEYENLLLNLGFDGSV